MFFSIARKGYNTKEVEEYIYKEKEKNQEVIEGLRQRVDELRNENERLNSKLLDCDKLNGKISEAILLAMDFKDKLVKELTKIKELEEEKLFSFKERWQSYLDSIPLVAKEEKEVERASESFLTELSNMLVNSLDIPSVYYYKEADNEYKKEKERLSKLTTQTTSDEDILEKLGIIDE